MSDNQGLYSTEQVSKFMNISERRLEQLTKKKIIPKVGRGIYDLAPAVQAYIRYLQGLHIGIIKDDEPSELDKRLLEAKVLERESKARQAKYRADAMEQDLQKSDLLRKIKEIPKKISDRVSQHYFYTQLDENVRKIFFSDIQTVVNEILNGCDSS